MTTISTTFTADGVSDELRLGGTAEDVVYSVTGPFDGLVELQRSVTPSGAAWETIAGPWDSISSSRTDRLRARPNDRIRFRLRDGSITVTNGDFASATGWTLAAPWSIGSGVATRTASASDPTLTTTIATGLVTGASYSLAFTMTRSAGSLTASVGGTAGTARSSSATFTETIVAGATDDIVFTADASFAGTIDNVTLTPVITYSLSDDDMILEQRKDASGTTRYTATQDTHAFTGAVSISGALTLSGAITVPVKALSVSTSITVADHDGRTIVMSGAGGARTFTLPAATGSGARFRFVVGEVNTSNYVIQVTGDDTIDGTIVGNSTGDAAASALLAWKAGAADDTITLNGTTTGGASIGDYVELEDIATDQWAVRGFATQSGTEATMFSTAV